MDDLLQQTILACISDPPNRKGLRDAQFAILASTVGNVREENQDRALVMSVNFPRTPERNFRLAAVCDGIGGMLRGGVAAEIALGTFAARILRTSKQPIELRLADAVARSNTEVFRQLGGKGGTTIAASLFLATGLAASLWVGDSRVYALDGDRRRTQLSRDDSLGELLQGIRGRIAQGARERQLVQFVGMGDGFDPHVVLHDQSHKQILLTTDGAHSMASDTFEAILRSAPTSSKLVENLISLSEMLGGIDNATAVLIDVDAAHREAADQTYIASINLYTPHAIRDILIPALSQRELPSEPQQFDRPATEGNAGYPGELLPSEPSSVQPADAVPVSNAGTRSKKAGGRGAKGKSKKKLSGRRKNVLPSEGLKFEFPDKK